MAPNLYFTGPGLQSNLHLPALAPQFVFTNPGPGYGPPSLFLPVQVKILLLLPQPLVLSRTATTTTSITTTIIPTTTTTNNNNKRYLHGSKIRIKWPLECI